jgi:hypothetical protein
MRKMVPVCGVVMTLFASLLFASPAQASGFLDTPTAPPTDKIVIDVVAVNGTGCPGHSAEVTVSQDNTAFTVIYSQYMAQVGLGAKPTDLRKNCQIAVVVHVPQGFTFAIAKADYRGFASVAAGASVMERANYYFQGQTPTAFVQHSLSGAFENDWETTDQLDLASLVFADCGALRNLNINTELRAAGGTSNLTKTTSFISMDSTDGSINTLYHFAWKRCTA